MGAGAVLSRGPIGVLRVLGLMGLGVPVPGGAAAQGVDLIGLDEGGFSRPMPIERAQDPTVLLAHTMNGVDLPPITAFRSAEWSPAGWEAVASNGWGASW